MSIKSKVIDFLCVCFVVCSTVLASLHPVPPADLWWQLAVGRYIDLNFDVLRYNIFSYSAFNFPITDHEWLCEWIFYKIHSLGGLTLLYIFKSLIISSAFVFYYLTVRKKGVPAVWSAIGTAVSAFFANLYLFGDIRPYIFTYLFLSLLLYVLSTCKPGDKKWFILPVILVVWANVHAGYMLYFAVIGLFMFSAFVDILIETYRKKSKFGIQTLQLFYKRCKSVLLAFLVGFLVIFLNPYGLKLVLYPFSFSHDSFYKAGLIEWVKPNLLGTNLPFLVFFLLLTLLIAIFIKKFRIFELLLFLSFGYLSFTAVRHITLFAMISSVMAASVLYYSAEWLYNFKKFEKPKDTAVLWFSFLLFIVMLFALSFTAKDLSVERLSMAKSHFPYNGIKFLQMNGIHGNIYHPYGWGGYIIWNLYPSDEKNYRVFIDGRANVAYPEDIFRESIVMDFGYEGWEKIMDKYDINTALCSKYHMKNRFEGKSLVERLVASGKWQLVYEDRAELVFIRKDGPDKEFLAERIKKAVYPKSPFRAVRLAEIALAQGESGQAIRILTEVLNYDESDSSVPLKLAEILVSMGQKESAKIMIQEALRREPASNEAREYLKKIEGN